MKFEEKLQEWIVKLEKVEMHKCERCPKVFIKDADLVKHAKRHDDDLLTSALNAYVKIEKVNIFDCDHCRLGFLTKTESLLHRVEHIQKSIENERLYQKYEDTSIAKPYKCPECDYRFVAVTTLKAHSVVHRPFPHICHCGVGYYEIQDLNQHKKLVHRVKVDTKTKAENKNHIRKRRDTFNVKLSPKHPEFDKQVRKVLDGVRRAHLDIEFKSIDDKFQCPDCSKLYPTKASVKLHYRSIHRGERPYCCNLCSKSYTQAGPLIEHLKKHAGIKDFKCQYCDKLFYNIDAQDRHERTHTGSKPFVCSFCDKAFSDPSAHTRHERIHTGDKRYRCQLCPKAFTDHSALYAHKKRHENKRDYKCDKCGKRFFNKSFLYKHISVIHNREYKFTCDYCQKVFSSKGNLSVHIQSVHTHTRETSMCQICFKTMLSTNLKKHMGIHDSVKKFTCDICYKQFHSKDVFVRHLSRHNDTNVKKFECHNCSKRYYSKAVLAGHIYKCHVAISCKLCYGYFLNKTRFKEHKLAESESCDICDKEFFCKGKLDKHVRHVHIRKPQKYECDYCSFVFTKRSQIVKHIARLHTKPKLICDHCGQRFALKQSIRSHMISRHLDTLRCNICLKSFYSRIDLKQHKKTNCIIKKYSCNICGKLLNNKSSLKYHEQTHDTNRELFKCPFCAKELKSKLSVLRHLILVHEKKSKLNY